LSLKQAKKSAGDGREERPRVLSNVHLKQPTGSHPLARALERTEAFFWGFCDDYLELVKGRAYGEGAGAESARATLRLALGTLQRLFAPFLPFVAEEVWSWWQDGSVHTAPWPEAPEVAGDGAVFDDAAEVLAAIRRAKTEAKRSMKAAVAAVQIHGPAERLARIESALGDITDAGNVADATLHEAAELRVAVTLADEPAA